MCAFLSVSLVETPTMRQVQGNTPVVLRDRLHVACVGQGVLHSPHLRRNPSAALAPQPFCKHTCWRRAPMFPSKIKHSRAFSGGFFGSGCVRCSRRKGKNRAVAICQAPYTNGVLPPRLKTPPMAVSACLGVKCDHPSCNSRLVNVRLSTSGCFIGPHSHLQGARSV